MSEEPEDEDEIHIPFLSSNEEYVLGFEMGMIFAQMYLMNAETIDAVIGSLNEEQLQVIAKNLGYEILSMEEAGDGKTKVQIYLKDHTKSH